MPCDRNDTTHPWKTRSTAGQHSNTVNNAALSGFLDSTLPHVVLPMVLCHQRVMGSSTHESFWLIRPYMIGHSALLAPTPDATAGTSPPVTGAHGRRDKSHADLSLLSGMCRKFITAMRIGEPA